jgi:hypothetical protein
VDDVAPVKVTQCEDNLSTNELNCGLLEAANFVNIIVDVAAWQVLQKEVDFEFILKDEVHRVNERMVRLEQNILLVFYVLHLLLLK